MNYFDCFIGINWTGAKSPIQSKSIAVSVCDKGHDAPRLLTQKWSRQFIKRAGSGNQNSNSDHDSDAIISAAGLRYLCGASQTLPPTLSNPHPNRLLLQQEGWIFGVEHT